MYFLPALLYICYVFTNVQILRPLLQPLELVHILAVLIAIIGLIKLIINPNKNILSSLFVILVCTVFPMMLLSIATLFVPLQVIAVVLASLALNAMIEQRYIRNMILLFILCIITIVFIDYYFNETLYLYNSVYGRERLLLGFWHPKEAAISVFTIAMMCLLAFRRWRWVIQLLFFILLLFIDSRNIILLHASICFILLLARRTGYLLPISIVTLANFSFAGALLFFGEALDELSSGRQTYWQTVAVNLVEFRSLAAIDIERTFIQYDNYYLGYAAFYGLIPLVFLVIGLACIVFQARNSVIHGLPVIAFFIPYCFYFIYDGGLFSSGNFLNYLTLTILFVGAKKNSTSKLYEKISCSRLA